MDSRPVVLRKLGVFERGLTLSDQHSPLNVVSVLRLENPPAVEAVARALGVLVKRQPLLRAAIRDWAFVSIAVVTAPLTVRERAGEEEWLAVVEGEMGTPFDVAIGPLHRMLYLHGEARGEIIWTFQHSIMDAASGANLLDELMRLCAGGAAAAALEPLLEAVAPAAETRFPARFRGARGAMRSAAFVRAQMADEVASQWRMRGQRKAAVRAGGAGHVLTLRLPAEVVDGLARRCRVEKVTLHSLLNAVMMLAVDRQLYGGQLVVLRAITFADLRPYTEPPTPAVQLANYISMLRFTLAVSGQRPLWALAKELHAKIYRALKSGDKFTAMRLSESLMRMFIGLKSMRMSATALNYLSAIPIAPRYGDIGVASVHGFVSGFGLGPELASQARLFRDELWWDFVYLDSDMDRATAERIVAEIHDCLCEAPDAPAAPGIGQAERAA